MWCKTKMAIAALLISGISVALIDVASAESAQKGARAPKWGDPGYYQGWVAPPARAGGVGFKKSKKKKKAKK
jgi:hypothetical protein